MTSSGFADGLGRRTLAFDREEGVMLERLVLRPELGAFETMLRDRLDALGTLEDERIARPRTIERDVEGSLVVVSEFVPGSRLAELLDTAVENGTAPGMDAALGFLLDLLPALCGLHAGAGFAHGSISPSRTVLTPAGQIVLLDAIYGGGLAHLRYSRRKLWTEFAVATSPRLPARRIHVETDLAQAALAAVMLVLGRPLANDEYPDKLAGVVREVSDVAQIRGSAAFASGVQSFLHRALQLNSSDPYASADDALFDVREVATELGLHVCRRALVDFIEQMEAPTQPRRTDQYDDLAEEIARFGLAAVYQDVAEIGEQEQDLDAHVDAELDIDRLVESGSDGANDTANLSEVAVDWVAAAAESTRDEAVRLARAAEPEPFIPVPAAAAPAPEPVIEPAPSPALSVPEETVAPHPDIPDAVPTPLAAAGSGTDGDGEASESEAPVEAVPAVRSRRAKRATRSARARKDKLHSAAEHDVPVLTQAAVPAPPAPPPPAQSSSWLVAPGQAAAFEPAGMDATPAAPVFVPIQPSSSAEGLPATPHFALAPPVPIYTPPPLPPAPVVPPPPVMEPAFSRTVGSIAPSYDTPPAWTPAPPPPPPPAPVSVVRPQPLAQVKLKDSGPRPRAVHSETTLDIYSTPLPTVDTSTPTSFPWKLVAALAVILVGAIVGGRAYLPAKGVAPEGEVAAPATSVAQEPAAATPAVTPGATTGRIEIETQPAGARVLLNGKPAGDSPVSLEGVAAGRHTITLVSSSGSIKRTIRVDAGRTTKLDIPIFSGWVGIFAPFVVEVSEGGKVIGTTEESRLMLSPGRHELTLVNRELGYRGSRTVDIEPGEVRSITLDPRGAVNFNASPWAEVWIDGRKVGDTPIANLQLPLGIREVTFRHPQYGERRVPVTVKGDTASAISIDFTKPLP
jgi:PEGA domain